MKFGKANKNSCRKTAHIIVKKLSSLQRFLRTTSANSQI